MLDNFLTEKKRFEATQMFYRSMFRIPKTKHVSNKEDFRKNGNKKET